MKGLSLNITIFITFKITALPDNNINANITSDFIHKKNSNMNPYIHVAVPSLFRILYADPVFTRHGFSL